MQIIGMGKPRAKLLMIFSLCLGMPIQSALALPPPQDKPESILRTEIILDGRSPIDGRPLNASEYVLLQEELGISAYPPQINPQVRQLIVLLRLRKFIKTIIPF